MGALLYYIFLMPLIYLVSIMPFWILYGISDFFFVLIYYVFGYRRKVVMMNLKNAFPEKNVSELKEIERKFFRHLSDTIFETIKLITISKETLLKRMKANDDLHAIYDKLNEEKRSSIVVIGHCGNWEWANVAFGIYIKQAM